MYLYILTTFPNEKQKEDDYKSFQEEQDGYFGVLVKNGQILLEGCNTIQVEDKFITYFLAPKKDSLDSKNNNRYVHELYLKLLELCKKKPNIKLLGKSSDYELSCNCISPSWYMLYSDYMTHESPVVCGDCGRSVPLYKLPKILGEEEYFTVLGWQRAYNACDHLFLEGIGERGAYQRLSNPVSDLSKLGREICDSFGNATNKAFYYYLFRYYSSHKLTCPICGEKWKLAKDKSTFIDYRCNKCRLVADIVKKR